MDNELELQSLSDDELLRRVSDVLAQSRRVEWVLVAHIAEVDVRRLYARQGSPSMFHYYSKTNKPRKNLENADTSPGVRGISAAVKRAVWERDGGRCTFVSSDGKRCPERHRLEFHHDEPYALGGDRSADNIRLACHAHNDYMAEMDYGKAKMDQYRVREPQPTYGIA